MKKLLVPIMVLALVALTVPAWAQTTDCNVSLDAAVTITKDVTITQTRTDNYATSLNKVFDPAARADAEAVKNDLNTGNSMTVGGLLLSASTFTDTMSSSFNTFTGIGQSNQAAGSMNNQGNVVAVAYVSNPRTYASSLAAVGDTNTGNNIKVGSLLGLATIQSDTMTGSFMNFTGIGQSNQSAGSMNNQNNVVSIAAGVGEASVAPTTCPGIGSSVAVAASELALNNTGNTFNVDRATFTNTMTGSYSGFTGIGQSNQSAGNMNNQVNVISVAASVVK